MKVAALQTDIAWEDPAANFETVTPRLREAAEKGARLLVLPELFACGFSMNTAVVAEPPDGPSATFLRKQARDLDAWVCATVPMGSSSYSRTSSRGILRGIFRSSARSRMAGTCSSTPTSLSTTAKPNG